jgi:hypothetical protein
MTKEEANELLDSVKDGNHYPSIRRITEALWVTGDATKPLPIHPRPFSEDGINEWMESTRMAQSQGTGTSPIGHFPRNQSGIDRQNESTE